MVNWERCPQAKKEQILRYGSQLINSLFELLDSLVVWQLQYDPDHTDGITQSRIAKARTLLRNVHYGGK